MAVLICYFRTIWSKKRLKPQDILGRPLTGSKRRRRTPTTED